MTGIDYPTITIGAHKDMVVRFSLAAQKLLGQRGLNPGDVFRAISKFVIGPDGKPTAELNYSAVDNMVLLFSCMVAENFLDLSKPHLVDLRMAPSADYWTTQIDDFGAVEVVVTEALKKAAEERRKRLAVVPPMEAAS